MAAGDIAVQVLDGSSTTFRPAVGTKYYMLGWVALGGARLRIRRGGSTWVQLRNVGWGARWGGHATGNNYRVAPVDIDNATADIKLYLNLASCARCKIVVDNTQYLERTGSTETGSAVLVTTMEMDTNDTAKTEFLQGNTRRSYQPAAGETFLIVSMLPSMENCVEMHGVNSDWYPVAGGPIGQRSLPDANVGVNLDFIPIWMNDMDNMRLAINNTHYLRTRTTSDRDWCALTMEPA